MLALSIATLLGRRPPAEVPAGFSPSSLFAASEVGVWYDPSDFSTLYQDTAGSTPVTAVEQPVGLMLDKSQGLVLGSELFSGSYSDLSVFTSTSGSVTYDSTTGGVKFEEIGGVDAIASRGNGPSNGITVEANAWYRFQLNIIAGTDDITINVDKDSGGNDIGLFNFSGIGTKQFYFKAPTTNVNFAFVNGGGDNGNITIGNFSLKKVVGNHAVAANNSTARPVLRARYNLLTYSQAAFSNAAWSKTRTSIGSETITAPDSTSTASVLIEDTATGSHSTSQTNTMIAGASYVASVYAKDVDGQYLIISAANTTNASLYARAAFDLSVGTVANTAEAGTGYSVTQATIASVGSGWYRCTLKFVAGSTAPGSVFLGMSNTSSPGAYGLASYTGTSRSIYIWGAQLVANSVFPANTYQRIAAATDYATGADFPPYLAFTTDDAMSTASIDFSGTDEMSVFAGVTKNSDATTRMLVELSAAASLNNGAFDFTAPNTNGYGVELRGTAAAAYLTATQNAPNTAVLSALYDISQSLKQDEIISRLNGVVDQTTSVGAASAGTGNFGNYPLYIGARNNASLFFNGSLYSLIVRGKTSTAQEIDDTEAWVANKTGVTL